MRYTALRRPMPRLRREKWTWRCQWSFVTIVAIALVLYNAAANMWLLHPPSCPVHTAIPPTDPPTCEPCVETAPNNAVDDDPIAKIDLKLGRWDGSRSFRLFDYAAVGDLYSEVSSNDRVCLATQSSIERLHELLRIASHWTGPISVAVYVAGDELRLLRAFTTWLFRCQPELYSRVALHVATPIDRPGYQGAVPNWARDCDAKPLPPGERRADTVAWRARHPYPQNHLRNQARKNCQTPYVFLVDVDIVPSKGMAGALDKFLATAPKCTLCAYVVPTYELDRRVANFPTNKSELLRLSRNKLAIPFHRKVFIYNQYASNFSRWEASGGNESIEAHISHNVTNFELLYEPFYVAPDTVPAHDERFLGYGFTRNTQEATEGDCCSDTEDNADEQELQDIELEAVCPELSGQIIGGRPSSVNRHPYQVSMVMNGNSFCGGFIISRDYVLTAAHCVQNVAPNAIRLRVGSTRRDSGGRIVRVSNVTVHPQYGQPQFDNDIAALRLAQPLNFNAAVRPIRLPQVGQNVPLVRLTVTGWGLTAPGGRRIPRIMMEAQVPVVPHWLCRLSYGDALTTNMFCGGHFLIGGVSSCQGDSGGPAVFRGTAFGIVSFARGCALPLSPTVFSSTAALRNWITDNTGV